MKPGDQSALDKAREAMAAKRAAGEEIERVGPLEKHRRNPTSRKLAIVAMCVRCMGGDDTSPQRAAIRDCTAPSCPLYPVRPYQRRVANKEAAS